MIRRLVAVRDDEIRALAWAFLYFLFLLTAYTAIRPLRDEMGVAGGVANLPWLFTGTFAVMLLVVPLWSALMARVPRRTLLPLVYHFFAFNLIGFFFLLNDGPAQGATASVFFVWTSVFNLLAVSIFWSFMADIFRHEQARRLFAFIAAGGSAGAILGPLLTSTLVGIVGPARLLLLSALLLEAVALCVRRLDAWQRRTRALDPEGAPVAADDDARGVGGDALGGIKLVFASPYLRSISGYTFFITLAGTFGYILQAHLMVDSGMTPVERTTLFARIDLTSNVITLMLELFVTAKIFARFGVGNALMALPALAVLTFGAQVFAPTVAVSSAMQVLRRAVGYAIAHPAMQILFTVVTRQEKYKSKAFIDTVVYRGGDLVSSWAVTALLASGLAVTGSALVAVPLAGLWLAVARRVLRRYRDLEAR